MSFALPPIVLATFDQSGRQIGVFFAAVILTPVAVATVFLFDHLINPFSNTTGSSKLTQASRLLQPLHFP